MFYSQFILAKKGPLGTIWIAAHLERKLRKNQVADTDIGVSVDSILFPEMPIALRLSSHLLLGVVRIYSRKVNYLFDDCSEALLKVKQAFRSTAVDLPPEESTAPYHSITLPETFDLDDFELPDSEIFQGNYVDHHISSKDQITLQDTMDGVVFSTSKFGLDERFGDGDDASGLDLDEELMVEKAATAEHVIGTSNSDVDAQASGHANAGIVNQQIEDYDGENEPVDYAQAPCTPGLWEEPNLSKIQETSACDDHQEPENHTIPEFAVKENASSKDAYEEQQNQNLDELHEKSLPEIAETEELLMNDVGSSFTESVLADHVRSMSEDVIPISDDPAKVQDLQNSNFRDGPPGFQTLDLNHENCVEYQDSRISVQTPHETIQNSTCVTFQNHQTSVEVPLATEAFREHNDSRVSIQSSHENMQNSNFPTLRPCVTFQNHETNGQEPHATETFQTNFPEIHSAEIVQVASSMSNCQVENPLENVVEFPAPEKLLSLPQDVPKYFVPEATPTTETDITISGTKRSFTESSLTGQSLNLNESSGFNLNYSSGQNLNFSSGLNLNESSGFFTTSLTTGQQQSVMNDDDLLSSILVGRKSSILKMKPAPPVQPPTKRQRRSSAPKTGILKRKVVMDDNMVLHGDTIRQQLTNTEDIRRLRKKAPCTRAEISMLEKQFWEDELFTEPILIGVSIKLASLHNQSYDLRKIVILDDAKSVTKNNESDIQPNVSKEIGIEDEFDPVSMKYVSETQPIKFNHTFDNNTTNLDDFGGQNQTPMHETENIVEPLHDDLLGQETAMDIDPQSFPDTDIGVPTEVENLIHDDVVPHDMSATLGELETTNQMDVSLQADVPGVHQNEKTDLQSVDFDTITASEIKDDVAPVTEILEEKHDQDIEFNKNEENVANDDVANNAQNLVYNGIFGEDFVAYDAPVEDIPRGVEDDEFTHSAVEHDTDFLNFDDVDDDDEAEAGGDYAPDVQATRVIDNSGWSSRTKAVARYLQIMFDKEGERGMNMVHVNNLLIGKTRKEASRMFFETLVLKTKDYIHVEQADPYDNINVFPRAKLLKSEF